MVEVYHTQKATHHDLHEDFIRKSLLGCNILHMRSAIGFIIVLYGLSTFLSSTFQALDSAATQSLQTLQTAAAVAEQKLIEQK